MSLLPRALPDRLLVLSSMFRRAAHHKDRGGWRVVRFHRRGPLGLIGSCAEVSAALQVGCAAHVLATNAGPLEGCRIRTPPRDNVPRP